MKRKALSLLLVLCTLALILPAPSLALDGASLTPAYVAERDAGGTPASFTFDVSEADCSGGAPTVAFRYVTSDCEVTDDLSDADVIINGADVTVGEGGFLPPERVWIFGGGSLTVGELVFTSDSPAIADGTDADGVFSAYTSGAGMLYAEGSFSPESAEWIAVRDVTVPAGKTLALGSAARLIVSGSLSADGTLAASQDAQLILNSGASVSGITLYDETGSGEIGEFFGDVIFCRIERDEFGQNVRKWVLLPPVPDRLYGIDFSVQGRGGVDEALPFICTGEEAETSRYESVTMLRWDTDPGAVTFRLVPDEGSTLEYIRVEQDCSDVSAALDPRCTEYNGVYEFTFSLTDHVEEDGEHHFAFITFLFSGWDGSGFPDNTFEVCYNDYPDDTSALPQATVSVGGTVTEPCSRCSFETGTELTFVLDSGVSEGFVPVVRIEVFDGDGDTPNTLYDSAAEESEGGVRPLALTALDGGGYSFVITPGSGAFFSVSVLWNERDVFDSFGYDPENEYQLCYSVCGSGSIALGTGECGTAQTSYTDEEGCLWVRQNVLNSLDSVTVTFTPEEGSVLDSVLLGSDAVTVSGSTYKWSAEDFGKTLGVFFCEEADAAGAADYVEGKGFAYYAEDADTLKGYMVTELWNEGFGAAGEPAGSFAGIFDTLDALEASVTLTDYGAADGLCGLPYYTFTMEIPGAGRSAEGRVYMLKHPNDIIVMANGSYCVVSVGTAPGEPDDVCVPYYGVLTDTAVFGNGAAPVGTLEGGTDDVLAFRVTQEHSGLEADSVIGGLDFRLVLVPAGFSGARIVGDIAAEAWGAAEVPLFSAGSASSPSAAEIYYGNDGSEGRLVNILKASGVPGAKDITAVGIDEARLSAHAVQITEYTDRYSLKFNSAYDVIPVVITFSDGSTGYIDIHRVGLSIADCPASGGSFRVWHGTENSADYPLPEGAERAVAASFRYDSGSDEPAAEVSLFVTVKTTSGTARRLVRRINTAFIDTAGADEWCDDFLLWSGTDEEYAGLVSISAIVFDPGTAEAFGGVKVGSGTGVEWLRPGFTR